MEDEGEDKGDGSEFERGMLEMVNKGYEEWDLNENSWGLEANYIPDHYDNKAHPHDITNI